MSTRYFLMINISALIVLSGIAYALKPAKRTGSRIPLTWVTDPNPQREPQVKWYNKMYPDNFLRIDPDNSGVMKVVVQSSAGMGPDIIGQIHEKSFQTYLDAGILWDVTDAAKKMGFSPETLPKEIRELVSMKVADELGNLSERQFAYPCNVWHKYLIYNKNLFDKYNIPYPSEDMTWEEYIDIGKKLTRFTNKNSRVPDIFGTSDSDIKIILWGKNGAILNDDGTRCMLDSKEAADAFQFKHDLLYKHGIEPSPTQKTAISSQGGWGGHISWFGEGKVAMMWGARWMLIQLRRFIAMQQNLKEQWIKEHPNAETYEGPEILDMGACKVPRFKNNKRFTQFGARCAGINRNSKNREAALTFLQYLASEEYSKTINDGADSKPGNIKYNTIELYMHPDWPDEKEIHELSLKAIPDGKLTPRSQFVTYVTAQRIFNSAVSKMISRKVITRDEIKSILKTAATAIDLEIARNIKRNSKLTMIYEKMLENGAQPIKMDLKQVR